MLSSQDPGSLKSFQQPRGSLYSGKAGVHIGEGDKKRCFPQIESGNVGKAVLRYAGFRIKNPRKKEEVGHTVRGQGVCKMCMEEGHKALPSANKDSAVEPQTREASVRKHQHVPWGGRVG